MSQTGHEMKECVECYAQITPSLYEAHLGWHVRMETDKLTFVEEIAAVSSDIGAVATALSIYVEGLTS